MTERFCTFVKEDKKATTPYILSYDGWNWRGAFSNSLKKPKKPEQNFPNYNRDISKTIWKNEKIKQMRGFKAQNKLESTIPEAKTSRNQSKKNTNNIRKA